MAEPHLTCRFCRERLDPNAIRCPHCRVMLIDPDPISGLYELPDGTLWRQVDHGEVPTFFRVRTVRGKIDFEGDKTGVRLPADIIARLRSEGIGPETVFLTRSSAHRALMRAGWLSTSGKRVGPSPFYEIEPSSGPPL